MTLDDEIADLKRRSKFFVNQRRKDAGLYSVLADCLALCERVAGTPELERIRAATVAAQRADGKRAYFERDPDVYLIVGRAVFEPEANRAASWRYTATLREAAKRGLRSTDLVVWLKENGGINALFRGRPVEARTATTKTLHLKSPVTVPKEGRFSLTLARDARGFFDVVHTP